MCCFHYTVVSHYFRRKDNCDRTSTSRLGMVGEPDHPSTSIQIPTTTEQKRFSFVVKTEESGKTISGNSRKIVRRSYQQYLLEKCDRLKYVLWGQQITIFFLLFTIVYLRRVRPTPTRREAMGCKRHLGLG